MFHHDKTKFFNDKGIKILHIWEDDWCHKEEIVKSMIRNKLGSTLNKIDARKCRIVNLNVKECDIFLNSNHLQGTSKSSIRIALEYGDKIVSVLTFKKNGETYELTRFCNSININVRGSFTKLLNYFTKNYSKDIITFSDNSYSDGSLYEKCGFEIISVLKPDYKFVENEIRIHKFNFRNRDTKDIPKIWDCGKLKWQLIK